MSVRVMSLVWDNFKHGGSEKLVMLAMADWCNDEGLSLHPSHDAVARKCCISRSQAQRVTKILVDLGWLEVVGNKFGGAPGTTKRYRLCVEKLRETGSTHATGSANATGSTQHARRVAPSTETGSTHATQTTIEPSIEPPIPPNPPKKEKKPRAIERLPLPEWLDAEAWGMWMRHRKTLTPDAHNVSIRALTKLYGQGHDPVDVIEQSVMAGWTGLFQLKQARTQTNEKGQTRHEQLADKLADLTGSRRTQPSDPRVIQGTAERLD